ncbi:TetR family transcriptional regulator C-terminal domain-containing protein [Pseudochelatococcus sp. B33]
MDLNSETISKKPKKAETRARLIQIGTEILSEKGLDATGLDEVLRLSGVPKGSFYYYFESKTDFGLAVVDNYAFLWEQKLTRLLRDPSVTPLQRIHNYISESIRGLEKYSFRRGCLVGNLAQELAVLDDAFRARLQQVLNSWAHFLQSCLDEAKKNGELVADCNTRQLAEFFWTSWEGAILQAKLWRSTKPIEQFREVFFRLIKAPAG